MQTRTLTNRCSGHWSPSCPVQPIASKHRPCQQAEPLSSNVRLGKETEHEDWRRNWHRNQRQPGGRSATLDTGRPTSIGRGMNDTEVGTSRIARRAITAKPWGRQAASVGACSTPSGLRSRTAGEDEGRRGGASGEAGPIVLPVRSRTTPRQAPDISSLADQVIRSASSVPVNLRPEVSDSGG